MSWQIGEGGHGVGEVPGSPEVGEVPGSSGVGEVLGSPGIGGGPWQDGWPGYVTFQWPDMSEQEATTVPPGRRHSSFWSFVQVPAAWGQRSGGLLRAATRGSVSPSRGSGPASPGGP